MVEGTTVSRRKGVGEEDTGPPTGHGRDRNEEQYQKRPWVLTSVSPEKVR